MKLIPSFILACLSLVPGNRLCAQDKNTIAFTYDAGGKMTQRKVQVMQGARIGHFDAATDSVQRNFKVYPNPANSFVNIEGDLPVNIHQGDIVMMNINGQVLKTDVYTGQAKSLMVSDLKPGLYILEIRYSKKKKETYKIIVTN